MRQHAWYTEGHTVAAATVLELFALLSTAALEASKLSALDAIRCAL